MPEPMLEILSGDLSGRRYRVEDAEFVIGRAPNCDLVLPKRYISREHARISRAGRDFVIDGLSEKNPILVKDRPIRPKHRLSDGEEFELCGIRFRFHAQGDAGGPRRAPAAMSGADDPQESSWASDPDYVKGGGGDPTPDPDARARRDAREASAAPPRGLASFAEDDDTGPPSGPPARRSLPSDDELPVPVRGSGAVKRSSPAAGKVVFDAGDEEDEEEEATKELPAVGKSASQGSRESQNERTAELGKVKDPNDPDYDPFAEVDKREKKGKKEDPGREKALKALMILGAVGIILAAVIVMKLQKPPPVKYEAHPTPIKLALDQVVRFEEPWSMVDPPWGRTITRRDGEPYIYHRDNVVEVEWAVPHIKTKCVFLVRGIELGETTFEVQFPESRRIKTFTVIVEGDNPHDAARERRRAELRKKSPHQLRQAAETHLASGETYTKERDVTAREGYYRLAIAELAKAVDAAVILRDLLAQGGTVPADVSELVRKAEDGESKARTDYEDFVNRELARYRAAVQREARVEAIEQLQRCLRAINHDCDARFKRLRLILEESWGVPWAGDGSEVCGDRA